MILTVDPGKCTGYFADLEYEQYNDQLPAMQFCEDAWAWARQYESDLTIVYEKFTITAQTLRKARESDAIHVIGVLRFAAHVFGCELVEQKPGDAKNFATDDRLKKLGLYLPGKDHARDAARHYVVFAVRNGLIRPEEL